MKLTPQKRAAFLVLIAGGALGLWQISKETPPAAALSPSPQSGPSTVASPFEAPARVAEAMKPGEMAQAADAASPGGGTSPATPKVTAANEVTEPAPPRESDKPPVAAATAYASEANQTNAVRVQQDVGSLKFLLRDFRNALGGNPVGNNAEIVRALQGRNAKKLALKLWDGHRLNGDGELVDPWGSPYFFHQLSANEMEIRCAGPDRMMWNKDDIAFQ